MNIEQFWKHNIISWFKSHFTIPENLFIWKWWLCQKIHFWASFRVFRTKIQILRVLFFIPLLTEKLISTQITCLEALKSLESYLPTYSLFVNVQSLFKKESFCYLQTETIDRYSNALWVSKRYFVLLNNVFELHK